MTKKNFYSRSPEEWKRIDEEKIRRRTEKSRYLRKRTYIFLFMNLFIIAIIVLGYFIFKNFPRPQQPYTAFHGNLNFQLLTDENYYPDEIIDVRVKAVNGSKKNVDLIIERFSINIVDESNSSVYKFDYHDTIKKIIEGYQSVLIFSLKHEKELRLKPGTYRIDVKIDLGQGSIRLQRTFEVVENLEISIIPKDDFYFPNEILSLPIYFINHSSFNGEIHINELSFTIGSDRSKILSLKKQNFQVHTGEKVKIADINFKAPSSKGIYPIVVGTNLLIDRQVRIFKTKSNVIIIDKNDLSSVNDLRIITDSIIATYRGSEIDFNVYLVNDSSKDKFLILRRFILRISKNGSDYYRYDTSENFRLMVPANSKRVIFNTANWQRIILGTEGEYEVEIITNVNGEPISYNYEILVH